jgi:hypothetical protein
VADGGRGILDGLRFLWRQPLLRAMTLLAGTPVSVAGGAGMGLIVVYAVRALGLARTDSRIGLLYSAAAAGGALAALALPRVRRVLPAGRLTLVFLALDAAALAWVALARSARSSAAGSLGCCPSGSRCWSCACPWRSRPCSACARR